MTILKAKIRQFFHCLFHLHRSYWARGDEGWEYIGCECGITFHGDRENFDKLMAFFEATGGVRDKDD